LNVTVSIQHALLQYEGQGPVDKQLNHLKMTDVTKITLSLEK
jgi:hypothetical protein